jgi:hypothetical protein
LPSILTHEQAVLIGRRFLVHRARLAVEKTQQRLRAGVSRAQLLHKLFFTKEAEVPLINVERGKVKVGREKEKRGEAQRGEGGGGVRE